MQRFVRGGWQDRYGWVLVMLTIQFVVQSFPPGRWQSPLAGLFAVGVILLTLRTSDFERPLAFVGLVLGCAIVAFALVAVFTQGEAERAVISFALALIFLGTTVVIAQRLFRHERVSGQTIFGAIDVYVMLGFVFAFTFSGMQLLTNTPFFADTGMATSNEFVYFSFVTLATLGYGDLVPASDAGRSLAVFETITGQLLLVTVLARLVSLLGQRPAMD